MPARNIKVISQEELNYLNSIYTFDIEDDNIVVYLFGKDVKICLTEKT